MNIKLFRKLFYVVMAVVCYSTHYSHSQENLVINGSFEQLLPNIPLPTEWEGSYGTTIFSNPADGNYYVHLNTGQQAMYQDIATSPNEQYLLSFAIRAPVFGTDEFTGTVQGGEPGTPVGPWSVNVFWGAEFIGTFENNDSAEWAYFDAIVTARSELTRLAFRAAGPGSPQFDDVRLARFQNTLVIPRGFDEIEDDGYSGTIGERIRLQEVYSSEMFPPQLIAVTALNFRRDGPAGPFSQSIPNLQIRMSATSKLPGELSRTYSENIGSNETIVFDGPLGLSTTDTGNSVGPHPFELTIPLETPFYYNPEEGNLLIEFRSGQKFDIPFIDASNDLDDMASRVFGFNENGEQATFSDTGADIIELEFRTIDISLSQISQIVFNPQTGLYEQSMRVSNFPFQIDGSLRIYVSGISEGVVLVNSVGTHNGIPFLEFDLSDNEDIFKRFSLEYYSPNRTSITSPAFTISINSGYEAGILEGERLDVSRIFPTSDGRIGVEFVSVPGSQYAVEYSDDMENWLTASSVITAGGSKVQWIDDGPPKTVSNPSDTTSRFYRIVGL